MDDVLGEAWELVASGAMKHEDFRDFACDNAIRLFTHGAPDFFAGTAVEAYAPTVARVP